LDLALNIFEKFGKNFFWGGAAQGGLGPKFKGSPELGEEINSRPLYVQYEVGTGALGLTVWPQKLLEKVKILKFWLL